MTKDRDGCSPMQEVHGNIPERYRITSRCDASSYEGGIRDRIQDEVGTVTVCLTGRGVRASVVDNPKKIKVFW